MTGRSRRIVRKSAEGGYRLAVENRPASANLAETAAFMDDKKRILAACRTEALRPSGGWKLAGCLLANSGANPVISARRRSDAGADRFQPKCRQPVGTCSIAVARLRLNLKTPFRALALVARAQGMIVGREKTKRDGSLDKAPIDTQRPSDQRLRPAIAPDIFDALVATLTPRSISSGRPAQAGDRAPAPWSTIAISPPP